MITWKRLALGLVVAGVLVGGIGAALLAALPSSPGTGQTTLLVGIGLVVAAVPVIDRGLSRTRRPLELPPEAQSQADAEGDTVAGVATAWLRRRPAAAPHDAPAPTADDSDRHPGSGGADPLVPVVRDLLRAWDPLGVAASEAARTEPDAETLDRPAADRDDAAGDRPPHDVLDDLSIDLATFDYSELAGPLLAWTRTGPPDVAADTLVRSLQLVSSRSRALELRTPQVSARARSVVEAVGAMIRTTG